MRQRVHLLFLQRQSKRCPAIAVCARRRYSPVVSLRELHHANVHHRGRTQRIIEQRLTPQYVSVHATDLETRAYLLGVDKKRADISRPLRRLLDAGIEIHAQVVLCPGINDGHVLEKTIADLAAEYPRISSVAIVPLGLSRYNTDERLTPVTSEFCGDVIDQLSVVQ